jgi:rhodanese-related sulfurtransferase
MGGPIRINDEADPVQIEVETALERGIPTIPVLVSGASMPTPDELPDSLKRFSFHNAAEIDAGRDFHQHMERLIRSIDGIVKHTSKLAPSRFKVALSRRRNAAFAALAGSVAVSLVGGWALVKYFQAPSTQLGPAPSERIELPSPTQQTVKPARYASAEEAASACEASSAAIFYNDFKSPDSGWSGLELHYSGSNAVFKDGQLAIIASPTGNRVVGHESSLFRNATLCVRVKSPTAQKDLEDGGGGVVFWSTETVSSHPSSFFAVYIVPAGGYAIERFSGKSNYEIGGSRKFNGINAGLGAVNQIKITARANVNSVYFNGMKAQDFSGQPENDQLYVGLIGGSEEAQQNQWQFFDLVVAAPNFADELTNFGVEPQSDLRRKGQLGSATPTTVPGAHVIRTGTLYDAVQSHALEGSRFLMVDTLADDHVRTISGAIRMPYAGTPGNFNDDSQRLLSKELKSMAKNNLGMPIVFFCEGALCWESYNACLRALKIGFTRIFWYRGGVFSWEQAGLPLN